MYDLNFWWPFFFVQIRKQAIKDLPSICKANADNVPKIAEALTQLLQCEDPNEYSLVQTSLVQLFSFNAKGSVCFFCLPLHFLSHLQCDLLKQAIFLVSEIIWYSKQQN